MNYRHAFHAGNFADVHKHVVLARVIGTLVASRKEATLEGLKLLVVRACDVDGKASGAIAIAVDGVTANRRRSG